MFVDFYRQNNLYIRNHRANSIEDCTSLTTSKFVNPFLDHIFYLYKIRIFTTMFLVKSSLFATSISDA